MIRSSLSPIGLDIGARSIRAVQLAIPSRPSDLPRIVAAVLVQRLDPGVTPTRRETDRLMGILHRRGFVGADAVAAVPDDRLVCTSFELPASGSGRAPPLAAISRVELARAAGCGPQSLEVAAWPLPVPARARAAANVLAVGCLHSDADATLNALEASGLSCIALDARPAALARAASSATCTQPGICVVVDLDWGCTTAAVLLEGSVIYQRTGAETAAGTLLSAVRENLGVGDAVARRLLLRATAPNDAGDASPDSQAEPLIAEHLDTLGEDLAMAIGYASHRYPDPNVDLVLLTGDAARLRGAASSLAARLEAQVRVLTPSPAAACDPGLEALAANPALVGAMGLALWTPTDGDAT